MDSIPPPASTRVSAVMRYAALESIIPPQPRPFPRKVAIPYCKPARTTRRMYGSDLQGKILKGRYRVTFPLGRGGMSTVHLARDITSGRHFAIKVLLADYVNRATMRRRFFNEIEAVRRVEHEAIVKMYDLGELDDGRLFLVMEYVPGGSLKKKLREGAMRVDQTIEIIKTVAEGLRAAHRQNVIHRDLKPGNLLLPRRNFGGPVAKIVDFGIARISDNPRITNTSEVVGTPLYISPEQALGDSVDHRADVYALGVMTYEMLTGERLFTGRNPETLLRQHVKERPLSMRKRRPDLNIPGSLDDLVMTCLKKNPDKRPFDMSMILANLATLDGAGTYLN